MQASEVKEEKNEVQHSNTHFVLVHGITAGGWCWYKVRNLLEKSGYTVSCPDLKSGGIDPTDPKSISTFEEYNQPLIDLLSGIPENEKVILVGHSAGGLSVTDAVHKFGEKISLTVYAGATMLRRGFLTDEDKKDGIPSGFKEGSDPPPTETIIESDIKRKISYTTPSEDRILASMLTKDSPVGPIIEAKFPETPGIDEVTRVYIKTKRDKTLLPEQQDAMIKKWPPSNVFVLESDHNPNFATPSDLVGILVNLAKSN